MNDNTSLGLESCKTSRRELLAAFAGAAAGTMLPSGLIAQAPRAAGGTNPRRIDVHHHFQTPFAGNAGLTWWTPDKSLEQMDKFGIATAMMSHPGDGGLFDGTEK